MTLLTGGSLLKRACHQSDCCIQGTVPGMLTVSYSSGEEWGADSPVWSRFATIWVEADTSLAYLRSPISLNPHVGPDS